MSETAPTTAPEQGAPEAPSLLKTPAETMYPQPEPNQTEPNEPDPGDPEEPEGGEPSEPEREPEAGNDPDGDEIEISSVSDLVQAQEWDPEWFDSLKMPVNVDGEQREVSLSEMKASFQMKETAQKLLEASKAKLKDAEKEIAEKASALEPQYAAAAKLIENVESLLNEDVAKIDWNRLREEDPAEYSAKKDEVRERRERINASKREAVESYQKHQQEQKTALEEELAKRVPVEAEALLEKIPEWKDDKTAAADKKAAVDYAMELGFAPEDIKHAAFDHRLLVLLHQARLYKATQSNTDTAKKRVAKVPKVLKPGAKKDAPKPKPKNAAEILYG